jgi:glycosyltransferase involved in cell wall biosynthesis
MRQKLISVGFPAEQIQTIWNAVPIPEQTADPRTGEYVAFAGRLSQEKGVEVLLEVAKALPEVPFRLAGTGPMEAKWRQHAPPNVAFAGFLQEEGLAQFYRAARLLVVPSISYETFAIAAAEGMAFGLPCVASRIGALPEIICHGVTGYLAQPGNAAELIKLITQLWSDPLRCREMGLAGRKWAKFNFSKAAYISKLIRTYRDAQYIATGRIESN